MKKYTIEELKSQFLLNKHTWFTDINFVGGQNDGGGDFGGEDTSQQKPNKKDEAPIDDLGDGDINLDDIPF